MYVYTQDLLLYCKILHLKLSNEGPITVATSCTSLRRSNLDFPAAIGEIGAAVQHLRSLGAQKVGVVGFCMGGALTFAAGQHAGADAIAPYYGYNPQAVDLTKITCPVLFQSGTEDKFKARCL